MLRVCTIGLGQVGRAHADAYRGEELAQLVGVCDLDVGRAQDAAARLEAPAFGDAGEMLESVRPDLVSVCVGYSDPFAPAMQALERGCHVLCEPPLSNQPARAREMVDFARARGLILAADFNLRFTPAALTAKRWIAQGRLGTPLFINIALFSGEGAKNADSEAALWRLGHHGFDLARWLCGDIARLQCFAARAPGGNAWASAQVNLRFAADVVGGLTISREMATVHPLARCEVAGTTARLVVDNVYEELTLYPHASEEKTVVTNSIFGGLGSYEETYRCRVRRLLEQLAAGATPEAIEGSGAEAVAAQAALEAGIKSLETGEMAAPLNDAA